MRIRTKNNTHLSESVMNLTHQIIGPPASTTSSTVAYVNGPLTTGTYESMADVVVPGFKWKSAKGAVFNNPMSKSVVTKTATPGGFSFHNTGTGTSNFTDTYDGFYAIDRMGGQVGHAPYNVDLASLMKTAGTQAKGNIAAPTFEGTTFIGELQETIHFLHNPLKGYTEFLKKMRTRKNKFPLYKSKTVFDFVSDNWLSYRYAVRPLVYDAKKIGEAIGRKCIGEPKRKTARGFADASGSVPFSHDGNGYAANARRTGITNVHVNVRCGVLYEEQFRADVFGTHLTSLPSAIWEMIPYSFIADWFANIGDYVKAITPKYRVTELASWTAIKDERRTTSDCYIYSLDDTGDSILNAGHCQEHLTTTLTSRSPDIITGLAITQPTLQNALISGPASESVLNIKQVLDLVALAKQLNRAK